MSEYNGVEYLDPVKMSVDFDNGQRLIYVWLAEEREISETKNISEKPLVNIDYAADGTVLGVEIIA